MLNNISSALRSIRSRYLLPTFSVVFWSAALFFWYWFGTANPDPTIRSIAGKVVVNISDSIEFQQTTAANKEQPVDPVYSTFSSIPLQSKPDIYLFLIESYGNVVNEDPVLRTVHSRRIEQMETALSNAGWLSATTQSTAPVSGGLSWLSMSSTLSGLFIDNNAQYTSFINHIDTYPHLVRYLDQQGYSTITLQPPNRPRPGLPIENPFRFDHTVFFQELGYTGDPYGVWIVPDQYSIEFTYEHYIRQQKSPTFLFFETATTHAPWIPPPPLAEDWRSLNQKRPVNMASEAKATPPTFIEKIRDSYNNRFYKEIPNTLEAYYASLSYDFDVITQFLLNRADSGSLVIILGDHQPPLLNSTTYDTPLHIITQDSILFKKLPAFNFTPGMTPNEQSESELTHAGLYSMLVDLITIPKGTSPPLPSANFRPGGVAPSILP